MPKYNQPKGYRYKKGTIKREDMGGRYPVFFGLCVDGYWWCDEKRIWTKYPYEECPQDRCCSSHYGPIRSVKAAQRHIRNHPEIEKGTKITLVSLFSRLDVEFTK